jgi:hypothetical protein
MPEEIEEYERLSREQEAAMIDGDKVVPADLPPRSPALLWPVGATRSDRRQGSSRSSRNGARLPGAVPGFRESGDAAVEMR